MPSDMEFAVKFARWAGDKMVSLRRTAERKKKLDRTDVTAADTLINGTLVQAVRHREGRHTSIRGEEGSEIVRGARRVWVVDPIDGTGEYVNDSIRDEDRTSCVGLALLIAGQLALSVVHNPFRGEMFTATSEGPTLLNGLRIPRPDTAKTIPYDYCHWNGARFDMRGLERTLGKPRGCYSAIYQACDVVMGRSSFAVFPGDTIHDMAPAAGLVAPVGKVTDLQGRPLRWNDLNHGVIYATQSSHAPALRLIARL